MSFCFQQINNERALNYLHGSLIRLLVNFNHSEVIVETQFYPYSGALDLLRRISDEVIKELGRWSQYQRSENKPNETTRKLAGETSYIQD